MGAGMATAALGGATGFDLGGASTGMMLGSFAGPGGAAVGGGIGLLIDIVKNTGESAEAEKERLAMEKEEKDRERFALHSKELQRINFITGYLRSRSGKDLVSNEEATMALEVIATNTAKMAAANESRAAGGVGGLNNNDIFKRPFKRIRWEYQTK